jgi:hypothetical protein
MRIRHVSLVGAEFDIRKVIPEVSDAGMRDLENSPLRFRDLQFIRAAAP